MNYIQHCEVIFDTKVFQKVSTNIGEVYTYDIIGKAREIMKHYEKMLSFNDPKSDVGRVNSNKTKDYVKVSDETFEIIKKALYYGKITKGVFDITIGPVVKKWNIHALKSTTPDAKTLSELVSLVDFRNIELNYEEKSIRLKNPNIKLDLFGIVKGYVADKIIDFYKKHNISSAMLNIDGNIKVIGKKDDKDLWNAAIYETKSEEPNIACIVSVKDGQSIVTAESYNKLFTNDEQIYHHILDPKNGQPVDRDIKSVTIVSESSVDCDGFSTSIFIMGKTDGIKFMKEHNLSGFIITDRNELIASRDMLEQLRIVQDYKVLCF